MNTFLSASILFISSLALLIPVFGSAVKYCKHRTLVGAFLFNPFTYNFIIFILTGLSGSIGLFFLDPELHVNTLLEASSPSSRFLVPMIMLYGYFVSLSFQPTINKLISRLLNHDPQLKLISKSTAYFIILLLAVPILSSILTRLPLFLSISSASDSFAILAIRSELVETESSLYFFKRLLIDEISWIFCLYIIQRPDLKSSSKFFSVLLLVYFVLSLTKIKAILFILSLIIVRLWQSKVSLLQIFRIALFILALLIPTWLVLVKNTDLGYLLSPFQTGLIGRILVSEISSLYVHLSLFGERLPHIGLSSLSSLISNIISIDPSPRSGRIVLETISPSWVADGIGGVYNTVYFGEAFANFGVIGLLFSPFIVCFVYYLIVRAAFLLGQRLSVAYLVHTSFTVSMMAGFNDYLWNPFLYLKIGIFFLLVFLARKPKYNTTGHAS